MVTPAVTGPGAELPGRPGPLPTEPEAAVLLSQVAWFNKLRLLAAAGVIWMTALSTHALGVIRDPWPLYSLGALIALVDGIYLLRFPALARRPLPAIRRHVDLQIGLDLLILTALLHYSGGITNPLVLFYLFHAFIAALVLSVRAAVLVAAVSLALVTALALVERYGVLPHRSLNLGLMDVREVSPLGLWLMLLAYACTMGFSIYFVATVLARLRRREEELVRLNRQLGQSEKLASIGTLAAGVSHEINNPVGVIRNKVQILRYRIEDRDPPEQLRKELDDIDKHARRIGAITEGLLTFSRETPFQLEPLDLRALVREAVDLVRVPFESAGVRLETEVPPAGEGPRVRGSWNHLLQVLVNILLNARDASEGSETGKAVRIAAARAGSEAVLRIADRGTGIPGDLLDKIFDPFFTTKDVDRGTGLGLAISHGIVVRHGGRIEVRSEPGAGSEFRIVLPAIS